jgi:hypothetical protein
MVPTFQFPDPKLFHNLDFWSKMWCIYAGNSATWLTILDAELSQSDRHIEMVLAVNISCEL